VHLKEHNQTEYLSQGIAYLQEKGITVPDLAPEEAAPAPCGCPGMAVVDFREDDADAGGAEEAQAVSARSELRQWPIQLQLVSPNAPYFQDADLVIAADCVPFAHPNFHNRFLKGKALIIFCPKLDQVLDQYVDKLVEIFKSNNIKSISMVHMEVPCCFGLNSLVEEALKRSGKNIVLKEYTVSLRGEIL
jgi:hypothetical protein